MFMALDDQRIALSVPDMTTLFNMHWALVNQSATKDSSTSVTTPTYRFGRFLWHLSIL
jgi:hypothetical protein